MQEPSGKSITKDNWSNINDRLKHLSKSGTEELVKQGINCYRKIFKSSI